MSKNTKLGRVRFDAQTHLFHCTQRTNKNAQLEHARRERHTRCQVVSLCLLITVSREKSNAPNPLISNVNNFFPNTRHDFEGGGGSPDWSRPSSFHWNVLISSINAQLNNQCQRRPPPKKKRRGQNWMIPKITVNKGIFS